MKKSIFSLLAISLFLIVFPKPAHASYCFTDMKGDKTVSSDCTLKTYTDGGNSSRYISGVDSGTGSTNTAKLTVSNGTVTVNSNETLVTGSLDLSGGSIAIAQGAKIEIGKPMWVIDADGDGYPSSTKIYVQTTAPTNGKRVAVTAHLDQSDCNDSDSNTGGTTTYTAYIDNDGDGYGVGNAVQIQSCTGSLPSGYASKAGDCYDSNANAHPGQGGWFSSNRGDGSFDYNCDGKISHSSFCATTRSNGWGYAGGHGCRYNRYAYNYSTSSVSCGNNGISYAKEKFSSYKSTCQSGGGFTAYGLYGGTCRCH